MGLFMYFVCQPLTERSWKCWGRVNITPECSMSQTGFWDDLWLIIARQAICYVVEEKVEGNRHRPDMRLSMYFRPRAFLTPPTPVGSLNYPKALKQVTPPTNQQTMPLNIIIVGAGLIGPRHAQSVLSNPSTSLQALIDPAPSGATAASNLKTNYFPSLAALLQSDLPKPDAAIVCTPNHTHVPITKELLEADIHVLVEKPISSTIETGKSLLEYTQRPDKSHLKLLVGHHRRFNAYVHKTKQILDSGSLGRIIAVNGLWTLFKPESYFSAGGEWRRSRESGGGVVPINLVHDIDILHYFFGPVTRIHAEGTLPQRENPNHDAEEGAALTLRFASGVVGTFLVCDAMPSPHNFEAGTGENPLVPKVREGSDFYRIFGSNASLSVPDMTRWSYDGCAQKSWSEELKVEKIGVEEVTPFDLQLGHFVDVINKGEKVSCSGEDGLRALVVCQAVRRALETGETVELGVDLSVD